MPRVIVSPSEELRELQKQNWGRLSVTHFVEGSDKPRRDRRKYGCVCECGKPKDVRIDHLKSGATVSCGCYLNERQREANRTHGHTSKYNEVGGKTRTFRCWQHAKRRCTDPGNPSYQDYGAKGVKLCDRWLNSFENFLADMGECPSDQHTVDRYPDRLGDYEPGNCRWATYTEQNRNRDFGRVTVNGETRSLVEWCEIYDQDYKFAHRRIAKGEDPLIALLAIPQHGKKKGFSGTTK